MLALFLAHPWINDKAEKHASSLRVGGEQAGFPRQEDGGNLTALQLLQLFSQTGEFIPNQDQPVAIIQILCSFSWGNELTQLLVTKFLCVS